MNTMNSTIASEAQVPEEKVMPVTEERPEDTVLEEGVTVGKPFADDPKFKLRNVEVFYGDSPAIKNISLDIGRNEVIAFIGPSGCGKSTFLKTLLGQFSLSQGDLQLNTPLYYLDQHFGTIHPDLSVLDNLMELCHGIKESDTRTLLAGIGFRRDSVFRLGNMLSGGEKMKLAMLIVSHQPEQPLLLLDEPDNHLDLDSKIMLAQALSSYRGGFILVSHDYDFAIESGVNREVSL